jgi:Ca-activated chloride channel homolog
VVPKVGATTSGTDKLLQFRLRYKHPRKDGPSQLIERTLTRADMGKVSANFQLASTVASFGKMLRGSRYKGIANWASLKAQANSLASPHLDKEGYRAELVRLIEAAQIVVP